MAAGLAAAATGAVVVSGVVVGQQAGLLQEAEIPDSAAAELTAELAERRADEPISRSDRRSDTDPAKEAALSSQNSPALVLTVDLSDNNPRAIAKTLMPSYGFDPDEQFGCLDSLWVSESDWRINADNPTSTAYGIPQALTGLHDLPAGYNTSAEVQIRWGLDYIRDSYGTPCSAWEFKKLHNWY
jgi:hypothetical protein